MARKKKVIDLFAGCGGFSVGFERAGYDIIKAVEFDKEIAQSYTANHPHVNVFADDIGNIDDTEHFTRNESDIIIGGPPCQGFSMAGARIREKNAFINDPRNYLFRHYVNVVRIVMPKVFMIENVKGVLSKDGGAIFNEIVNTFEDPENFNGNKYYVHYKVCKAVDYGIPQKRERVVIIGSLNKDFNIERVFEIAKNKVLKNSPSFFDPVSLRDAISDIPYPTQKGVVILNGCQSNYQSMLRNQTGTVTNHVSSKHNSLAIDRMNRIDVGENWQSLQEPIHSVHSGAYGRLDWDLPTMTITTRFDTPAGGRFIHPSLNRTLTPREAARIQSFPDSFEFIGSKTSICKQIGNAVPPKLAFFLAHVANELI